MDVRIGLVDLTKREKRGNSAKIVGVKVLSIIIIHPCSEKRESFKFIGQIYEICFVPYHSGNANNMKDMVSGLLWCL